MRLQQSHLDPEVWLHGEEARDEKTRLQRNFGTQAGADLFGEALVDQRDELLVLAAVLLHIEGQSSREPAVLLVVACWSG